LRYTVGVTNGTDYDAFLLLSFGGPEKPADVMPFLEHVTAGKRIPRERLEGVAEHYYHFDGKSPINDQNRALRAAIEEELAAHGPSLPVYWGNLHWHPFLADTLREMKDAGVRRAICFATAAFSSFSSCRKYHEALARARDEVGEGAPEVDKIRPFYNHPGFIEPMIEQVRAAYAQLPEEAREQAPIAFTAHSIPTAMAEASDYVAQLEEASRLVAEGAGDKPWRLVYQSRSGPPWQPWLEPDIADHLKDLHHNGIHHVVVSPIGFVSDHMEVVWDLDTEAQELAEELGMHLVRGGTVGTHPAFVRMIRGLVLERMGELEPKAVGRFPPRPLQCRPGCCPRSLEAPAPS
jgi:ferrochelatase